MKISDKIRVAVLFGGRSAEHEVSLQSARNVIQYLDPSRFEIVPIGIDKQGDWFLGNDIFTRSLEQNKVPKSLDNDTWFTPEWVGKSVTTTKDQQALSPSLNKQMFDVVFPVVHGTLCEDGTLQGLLELANLPYVGCGVLSSAIGMDKDISKRLAINAGIPVPAYMTIKADQWRANAAHFAALIKDKLSYPVFVKPANTGSSIGVSKAKDEKALFAAIEDAFRFDTKIVVEKSLNNIHELEVAVLESLEPNTDPIISVVGEIKPKGHEFYSYDAKYTDEHGAELLIPAPITNEIKEKARAAAKELFLLLECEGMARVDLFFDKDTQQIYFNEINTLPGFTKISMYPKLMDASGVSYSELLTHLIQLAIKRYQTKSQLIRSYAG